MLKDHLKVLKLLQKFSLSEIEKDPFKTGALLHYLQLSAEISIDIGQMIIISENYKIPESSSGIFFILGAEKILPKKFIETFAPIARFRNLIVHEYAKIDIHRVYDYLLHELSQFEVFAKAIGRYLKKK